VATASQPRRRAARPGAGDRAVAVAVGLDDRAQHASPAAASSTPQLRSIGGEVDRARARSGIAPTVERLEHVGAADHAEVAAVLDDRAAGCASCRP
jgi:hypothetical protein